MKQLVETNWMHWRARMIVASFLTKDLLIDWRLWESFFKKHLLDYDENVNFWNWQWSASVWADPKPLRIFNPCLQSEKFDKNTNFIKKYLPILENKDLKSIHNPIDNNLDYIDLIVDHKIAQRLAREEYKK
jgi:deoxyribodipyrimidine photo-lyase